MKKVTYIGGGDGGRVLWPPLNKRVLFVCVLIKS